MISEARKGARANPGVRAFFDRAVATRLRVYLSVITVGELRRELELIRHRGDAPQADLLEAWLNTLLRDHQNSILPFDADMAQLWGRLRVPHHEHAIDKQIAATALMHDLTVVSRNCSDFAGTGVRLLNPFAE